MLTIKGFFCFFTDILRDRKILWGLAKNDFKSRFASSIAGSFWAFFQPLTTLLVMWFVFQVGFKNPPVSNVPFILWLTPAYLAWAFFAEAMTSGTNCLIEYSYLVKKIHFRVSMIPIIKIISSAFVHAGFILFIFLMMFICRVPLSIYNIQVLYYFGCTLFLLLGLSWLFSALAPFVKDVVSMIGVALQIGFWATPIFWNPETVDVKVVNVLKVFPMYYICQGYRDSFINLVWFWERGSMNLWFWSISMIAFVLGAYLFRKLRPQFSDVL